MRKAWIIVLAAVVTGCCLVDRLNQRQEFAKVQPTYSQFHQPGWTWESVGRVLVLPFLNESEFTRAGDEIRAAFDSEFQRMGRFEVIAAPPDVHGALAAKIHRSGRFDEAELIELADLTHADVIIHGVITQYSPYPRPRMGIIVQTVSPKQAKVVASVDGLWDTTDKRVSDRLRAFYRQRPRERLPFIRNFVIASDDAFAGEIALTSPALFQRFICHEVSLVLLGLPVPGIDCEYQPQPANGSQPNPNQANPNGDGQYPNGTVVLPTNLDSSSVPGP